MKYLILCVFAFGCEARPQIKSCKKAYSTREFICKEIRYLTSGIEVFNCETKLGVKLQVYRIINPTNVIEVCE